MKKLSRVLKETFTLIRASRALSTMVLLILVFSMLTTASVAWVTFNRKTDSDNMDMSLAVDDTQAIYKAYMFDLTKEMGTNLGSDGNPLNVTNIDLNQYDTVFTARNKYTPAFAKITLIRNSSMPAAGTVYLTIDRAAYKVTPGSIEDIAYNPGDTEVDAKGNPYPTSSTILRFTAFIIHDKEEGDTSVLDDLEQTTPEALYHYINSEKRFTEVENYSGNANPDSQTFVSVTEKVSGEGEDAVTTYTYDKATSLTVAVDYTASDWYKNEDGDDAMNVYLYITYDVDLIEAYMASPSQGSGEISLGDNSVFFKNDLEKITASYAAAPKDGGN